MRNHHPTEKKTKIQTNRNCEDKGYLELIQPPFVTFTYEVKATQQSDRYIVYFKDRKLPVKSPGPIQLRKGFWVGL